MSWVRVLRIAKASGWDSFNTVVQKAPFVPKVGRSEACSGYAYAWPAACCFRAGQMPRVTCARARNPCQAPNFQALLDEQQPASPEIRAFWDTLSYDERQQLLQVAKKALFRKIRASYCSRCYGLFALRYEELANGSTGDCPACQEYYAGLTVIENGALSLDPSVLRSQPFTTFTEAKARERERELQFMTGDICGSGWHKSKGQTVCTLHTSPVPVEALLEYWTNLPDEHRSTLFSMREEDFVAELDAHMKYHLKICRDCRSNVVRAYKDLKPLARDKPSAEEQLELCADHVLSVADGCVSVRGVGSAEFFERAEEVEDFKVGYQLHPDRPCAHLLMPADETWLFLLVF